jgi:hypothetical protein
MAGPRSAASAAGSAAARSRTVAMPRSASLRAVLAPMPHSARVGRSYMTSSQLAAVRRKTPSPAPGFADPGFANSVASLARSMLSPTPTEQCSRVRSRTSARIAPASASGSPVSAPTKASSHPITSTTTPGRARSVAMTSSDTSS